MRSWLPLLLLLMLPLGAFPAHAQSPACGIIGQVCQTTTEVLVTPPTEPVPPLGPFFVLPMTIRYTYVPTSFSLANTPIELLVTQSPPWLSTTLSPSTVYAEVDFVPSGAYAVTRTLSAFLLVSAFADAPAFTQDIVEVRAIASGNGNLVGSEGVTQVPIQAGYFGALSVEAPGRVTLQARDGVIVPLRVTNLGNAVTRVSFEVAGATAGIKVTPPGEVTLQSAQQGGEERTHTTAFALEAPGDFEAGPVVLHAVSRYALDPTLEGGVTKIVVHVSPRTGGGGSVSAQTLGGDGTSLNPLAFGALAAGLAGTVLLERARRRRRSL